MVKFSTIEVKVTDELITIPLLALNGEKDI
jgi:hypothetical protein